MTKKTDFFFLNVKDIYPNFNPPAKIDAEIWAEMLEPFEEKQIHDALKDYRLSQYGNFIPTPANFREFIAFYKTRKVEETLPLSPETYLMEQDIAAGRCKYFFETYVRGVDYVLNVKLKEVVGKEQLKKMTTGMRYRAAVDYGLFADFDEVLDIVYKKGY